MLSVGAQPLSRSIATSATRSGGMVAYLRAATFTAWMFSLVLYFWQIRNWEALMGALQEESTKDFFYVGFFICLAGHLTLGLDAWIKAPFQILTTWSGRLFTIFCALQLVLSPLSTTFKTSAIYSIATWSVYLILYLYWRSDYRIVQRMTILTGIVILGWLYLIWFKHGLSRGFGTDIGGLNRNVVGMTGIGGMICCFLSPNKKLRWAAAGLCVLLALAVDSRGSMVAMALFFLTYYTLNMGTFRAAAHIAIGMVAIGVMFLIVPTLNHILVDDILKLHDRGRGIGSGFTGRSELWAAALSSFWRRPVIGYGFRSGGLGAHSGYIKILVETGLVGFLPVVGAVVIEAYRRFSLSMRLRQTPDSAAPTINIAESIRINSVACATIVMMLGIWVYEQLYINIGSVICIVFFLMMVAPSFIARQGKNAG